ncbi:SRPBCC family protein [Gordonia jinhuaensis]|uniref:Polyketide cyclase n=1 Tax=Gordonia jinhuaensis TaxID=1517702 RepID=A0A916WQK2_9ACTN|nr:SRPBCC family protein [Gordonia jinhuaensis]GGB20411.1 polyketide cyclase [Gordonia jinhuaensis]
MAAPLIEGSIDIDASPEKVWAVISDLSRMGEWSPQCRKQIVRGGPVKVGTKTININRRGLLVWPTTATVVRYEPNKEIAYRINENNTVWSYTITPNGDGVRLTERREAPEGTTKVSQFLVDKVLGGEKDFEAELSRGIDDTLARIKTAVG